jgi:hypothetical protein
MENLHGILICKKITSPFARVSNTTDPRKGGDRDGEPQAKGD